MNESEKNGMKKRIMALLGMVLLVDFWEVFSSTKKAQNVKQEFFSCVQTMLFA
jgi:hypothetical protein